MLALKKFKKGGVHPPEKKFTKDSPIKNADYPKIVKIPLSQHFGAPAKCVVKKDDVLKEGDLIGEADGAFSANVHSSIQGKVTDIVKENNAVGLATEMVVIEFEGPFTGEIGNFTHKTDWQSYDRDALLKKIRGAGIVGLGGAAFPTHIKVDPPKEKKIEYLIANGAECEPFLTCDHRVMVEKASEIVEGLKIIKKLMSVDKAIIGIENNKQDAIKLLDQLCKNESGIDVMPLKVQYPQGAEKQLINAFSGKEVPSGGLPMDVGCVVSNVGTIFSVYEAVVYDKPIFERVLTVTGSIVKNPGNYKTRIGTPINDLLEECGLKEDPAKVIVGGPMMGFAQENLQVPIMKGTSGLLLLSKKEVDNTPEGPCIRCGSCIKACPMGLMPTGMKELSNANLFEDLKNIGLLDCVECGSCSYVCPARIPLVQYFRYGKVMLRNKKKYVEHKIPVLPL